MGRGPATPLRRREELAARSYAALYELTHSAAADEGRPVLFAIAAKALAVLLGSGRCLILTRDEPDRLYVWSCMPDGLAAPLPAIRYAPLEDPLQRIAFGGELVCYEHFLAPEAGRLSELMAEAGIGSALGVALRYGGEDLGMLWVGDEAEGRRFSKGEQRLLEAFALHLAAAMQSQRLRERSAREREELERAARRAQAVARVGAVVAQSLDLAEVLETVADLTTRELGADMLLIWLAEDGREDLLLAAQRNCTPELIALVGALPPSARSVAGLALRSGAVQIVEDVAALGADFRVTQVTSAAGGFHSIVAVPLIAHGQVVGQLNYMLKAPHHFSGEEVEAITTIGNQFAVAIRNAALYEESRAANRALLLNNMRLAALIEQLPEGVAVADAAGQIGLFNDAAAALAARQVEHGEVVAHGDFFHFCLADGRPAPPEQTPIARVLASGEPVTGEEWRYAPAQPGAEKHLLVNCAPLRDEAGGLAGAVIVCQDVTELRRAERLKDEFLAIASHELRTPLTSVKGYTQLVLTRLSRRFAGAGPAADRPACRSECERDEQQLAVVLRQINRLTGLVGELLDVSRLEGGRLDLQRAPLDIAQLVRSVAGRLQEATGHHQIAVTVESAPSAEELRADEGRLDQVLTNLIENAIKYSPEGGRIDVDVRVECAPALASASPDSGAGRRVVVVVRDQGVGIPADQVGLIFQRFYRASNALVRCFGGLGLGLHISREIIDRHGGEMWAESSEQQGSSFYFTLPLDS